MAFTDTFLNTLGAWQRGWRENQGDRIQLAERLKAEAMKLSPQYRFVQKTCFRKRFLSKNELVPLIIGGKINDGMTSWTTDPAFADTFKGLHREKAVTAVIFRHDPQPSEVILSIPALWASQEFKDAVMDYQTRNGKEAEAISNMRDTQSEVILEADLVCDEVVAFTGKSSPFDELCEAAGIGENDHDAAWKLLIDLKMQPEVPRYVRDDAAQQVIKRTLERISRRLSEVEAASSNRTNPSVKPTSTG